MGSFSLLHWSLVALVALVLFGKGRISGIMGDFGKGIRSFRHGLTDEEPPKPVEVRPVETLKAVPQITETGTQDRAVEG